jgi:hypothetical protein
VCTVFRTCIDSIRGANGVVGILITLVMLQHEVLSRLNSHAISLVQFMVMHVVLLITRVWTIDQLRLGLNLNCKLTDIG